MNVAEAIKNLMEQPVRAPEPPVLIISERMNQHGIEHGWFKDGRVAEGMPYAGTQVVAARRLPE